MKLFCLSGFILTIFLNSCSRGSKEYNSIPNRETKHCVWDSINQYYYYIPELRKNKKDLPLLIIIDPKGDGENAIERFRECANRFQCVLVSSNKIKNNQPDFIQNIDFLISHAKNTLPTGKIVFIAGFSGGSRMALEYAQLKDINGVIACGALGPPEKIHSINCLVYSIIGLADFNFVELAQYLIRPELMPENLRIIISHQPHEWPELKDLLNAFGYLAIYQNENSAFYKRNSTIKYKDYVSHNNDFIDSLRKKNDYLNAYLVAYNMARLNKNKKTNDFIAVQNSIQYSPQYNNTINQLTESIRFELTVREAYNNALLQKDTAWWINEINSLLKSIDEDKDLYRRFALIRIKAFLGIMCYSIANNAAMSGDLKTLKQIISVYSLVEPKNPDMYYYQAVLFYLKGDKEISAGYLKKAIDAGFSDKEKIARISNE